MASCRLGRSQQHLVPQVSARCTGALESSGISFYGLLLIRINCIEAQITLYAVQIQSVARSSTTVVTVIHRYTRTRVTYIIYITLYNHIYIYI